MMVVWVCVWFSLDRYWQWGSFFGIQSGIRGGRHGYGGALQGRCLDVQKWHADAQIWGLIFFLWK